MKYLCRFWIADEIQERIKVADLDRIDDGTNAIASNLNETQTVVVGLFPNKFGVERQNSALFQSLTEGDQILLCGYVHVGFPGARPRRVSRFIKSISEKTTSMDLGR